MHVSYLSMDCLPSLGHPFLQYMSKGSSWIILVNMYKHAAKTSGASKSSGGANVQRRGPKCQTWPRQPNRSCLPPWKGGEGHPFLQYMPKGSSWDLGNMYKHAAKHSGASKSSGGANVHQRGPKSAKPAPRQPNQSCLPPVNRRWRPSIPSIYAQRLLMGPS